MQFAGDLSLVVDAQDIAAISARLSPTVTLRCIENANAFSNA
jgi:hypothetical protein